MEAEPVAATVAGASPPARRSPRNGLPPSWSADEVYAHARAEWNNTDNALKEVPPSSWPWTMWANELHKSYAKKDGVAEAELQNLDTGTAERLGEELRRLVLAKAAVVRGGQLVDAFANAAAKPDAPAKRKLSVLENALTVLKAPKADDRARRRKVSSVKSSAARGPAASKKGKASTLSKIKPEQRILEHPDQGFIVDPNDKSMLYCQPCKASYGTTNQAVRQHLASDKHKENLDKWQSKEPERNLLLEVLESHRNEGSRASGAIAGGGRGPSLSLASIEFRAEVVQTSMAAGSPLLKLDTWRPLLEKYAHLPLTTAAHLSELVPPLHRLEEKYFREWAGLTERGSAGAQEVDAEKLAVIFDGTTRDGEAFVVLARKINKDTCLPEQRVMAVKLYARTGMKATEIAGALVEIICTRWGIDGKNIICMARDRASSNTAALEHAMFTAVFPNFLDSNCFAHTLCKPPEDCPLETAELLINPMTFIFSTSQAARCNWRQIACSSPPGECATRWGSEWEQMRYFLDNWTSISPWMASLEADDLCTASRASISKLLRDSSGGQLGGGKRLEAHLQLAAIVDFGKQFVQRLYMLEGDGFTFLDAFELLAQIETWIGAPVFSACERVIAEDVSTKFAGVDEMRRRELRAERAEKLMQFCKAVIAPGIAGFRKRFGNIREAKDGQLSSLVEFYKRARLLNPYTCGLMNPNADSVRKLAASFPLLRRDAGRVERLVAELPVYVSLCLPLRLPDKPDTPKDLTFQKHRDTHIAQFFASNKAQIPEFYSLFKDCALVTASSAGAERVFSLFSNTFGDQQTRSLEDYIETTLMLQYRVRELTWGRA